MNIVCPHCGLPYTEYIGRVCPGPPAKITFNTDLGEQGRLAMEQEALYKAQKGR